MGTWALTREWTLARETTVYIYLYLYSGKSKDDDTSDGRNTSMYIMDDGSKLQSQHIAAA